MSNLPDQASIIQAIKNSFQAVLRQSPVDIYVFSGQIDDAATAALYGQIPTSKNTNALLIMRSLGGDPDAAYRIARCLQNEYRKLSVFIPSTCKSAGTLIAIGAHELIMSDMGELGPIDIQLANANELGEMTSGLNPLEALEFLKGKVLETLSHLLVEIRVNSRMSTKLVSEISNELVIGLYGRIFQQLDPSKLGDVSRKIRIATSYGHRLNQRSKNAKPEAIANLATKYPCHSFVIDREEAKTLFVSVRQPTAAEAVLAKSLGLDQAGMASAKMIAMLNTMIQSLEVDDGLTGKTDVPHSEKPGPGGRVDQPASAIPHGREHEQRRTTEGSPASLPRTGGRDRESGAADHTVPAIGPMPSRSNTSPSPRVPEVSRKPGRKVAGRRE